LIKRILFLPIIELILISLSLFGLSRWIIMPFYDPSYGTESQFFDSFNQSLVIISAISALLGIFLAVIAPNKIATGWAIIAAGAVAVVLVKSMADNSPNIGGGLIFLVGEVLLLAGFSMVVRFYLISLLR